MPGFAAVRGWAVTGRASERLAPEELLDEGRSPTSATPKARRHPLLHLLGTGLRLTNSLPHSLTLSGLSFHR